jgi:hypothetical protein
MMRKQVSGLLLADDMAAGAVISVGFKESN